eukprot:842807-Amphidinium_carterae.1
MALGEYAGTQAGRGADSRMGVATGSHFAPFGANFQVSATGARAELFHRPSSRAALSKTCAKAHLGPSP